MGIDPRAPSGESAVGDADRESACPDIGVNLHRFLLSGVGGRVCVSQKPGSEPSGGEGSIESFLVGRAPTISGKCRRQGPGRRGRDGYPSVSLEESGVSCGLREPMRSPLRGGSLYGNVRSRFSSPLLVPDEPLLLRQYARGARGIRTRGEPSTARRGAHDPTPRPPPRRRTDTLRTPRRRLRRRELPGLPAPHGRRARLGAYRRSLT